ncbi:MAG: glucosyltransferase domain-containing protein [Clostridiales bacterium]|nr:glucosyltransferase domain-containing protein [Clostridiales bacterium]
MNYNTHTKRHREGFIENRISVKLMLFAGGVIIAFLYLFKSLNLVSMMWQMPDEGGYLYNASQFSAFNWQDVFSNSAMFYNYGYSLLLIPLFYICKTGISLIRGCMIVNSICVVIIYVLQVYLISKMYDKQKKVVIFVSFVTCFYPYLVNTSSFIYCEVFLYCWYLVIAAFLYKAVKTQKIIWYLGLGVTTAYIFFIHTRALVVIAGVCILFFMSLWKKWISKNNIIAFMFSFLLLFVLLYILKRNFISALNTGHIASQLNNGEVGNLLSINYFLDRAGWFLGNIKMYILCAIGKFFYIAVSTVGTAIFGIIYVISEVKMMIKRKFQKTDAIDILKCYFFLVFLLMYIACCVNGIGSTYAAMFYGRYYEYCILPIVIMGVFYLINNINIINKLIVNIIIICAGILSQKLTDFVDNEWIEIDPVRMSGISYSIKYNENYFSIIYFLIIITSICFVLYICLQKVYLKRILIPLIVLCAFILNAKEGLWRINETNNKLSSDLYISDYIVENMQQQKIYFIYEPYKYGSFYQRMQVFIKDYPMYVIFPEEIDEIEDGAFIITYINSELAQKLIMDEEYNFVMDSETYKLFQINHR